MPKGNPHPKPSPGRPKGVPNKSTAEIKAIALTMCPRMLEILREMAEGIVKKGQPPIVDAVRKDAAYLVLQYGVGKPKESVEHSGKVEIGNAPDRILELAQLAVARQQQEAVH